MVSIYTEQTQQCLHAPFIILQHVPAAYASHHQVEILQNHKRKVYFEAEVTPLQLKIKIMKL
jgi:hypothetical protein